MNNLHYSIIYLLLFVFTISANAQSNFDLKFNEDGKFKIVQFTDTHINLLNKSNLDVYNTIEKIIEIEKPDFIILTGDMVTQDNPQEAYQRLSKLFSTAKVPWAMVFGNHDSENNFSRKELADFLQTLPYCLNNDKGETYGNSNFIISVAGKNKKQAALLYCMDSNTYSTLKPTVDGYGWFDFSQINWYREKSSEFTAANDNKPLPALAFFHIPFPEYTQAWNNKVNPPLGVKYEEECSPDINTGMFSAMLERGDVMGTFVGHDHVNDYIGVHYGIALAYGRVTKITPYGDSRNAEDPIAGGRIIVLTEGERKFDTWIRNQNGEKELECNWPDFFTKDQAESKLLIEE